MKAGLIAPLYLSVSWILTVSYQLFTDTAVRSVASFVNISWPTAGTWITANIDTLVFVYAFTWIFVLSSVLPVIVLGRHHRSVIVQYIFVLALTLLAFYMADILEVSIGWNINDILQTANLLTNPLLAGFYLLVPYIFMLAIDLKSRRKTQAPQQNSDSQSVKKVNDALE